MTCIPSGPPSVPKVQISVSYRYRHQHIRRKPSKLLPMSSKATSIPTLFIHPPLMLSSYHQPHLRIRNVPGNLGNNPTFSGIRMQPFHHRSSVMPSLLYVSHLAYGSSRQAQGPSSKLPETRLKSMSAASTAISHPYSSPGLIALTQHFVFPHPIKYP